jgi:hypothetical protein
MIGVEWLITLAQHMAAGIVARVAETFWRRPETKAAAKQFNSHIAGFNSSVPDVLSKVLLAAYPDLAGRVLTVSLGGRPRCYPVVELIRGDAKHEALTISPSISDEHDNARHSEEFIDFLKETGRTLWDNEVFRLLAIGTEQDLILGMTRYYKALTSCDHFFFDLVQHFPRTPTDFRLAMLARRTFLKKWRKDVENIVVHRKFHHLSAAVGVSVFTVIKRPSEKKREIGYMYPCVENSDEKNGARDRHVIPAFMYESCTTSPQDKAKELDLEYQVLREFGEEIAGIPELRSMMSWEAVNATILHNPACNDLRSLLNNGRAVLKTTGLWLDLFRLRPEITCALIINDEDFYRNHVQEFKGSWENNPGVRWNRLTAEADYEALLSDNDIPLCPPAVASIVSGRRFALRYLKLDKGENKQS